LSGYYESFRINLDKKEKDFVRIAKGRGAVASVSKIATEIAINILKDGGNAFDASFALAFALTICHPQAGNIGGGGYLIFKESNSLKPIVINYREKSPSRSSRQIYVDESGNPNPDATAFGTKSVCIPGTIKAFFYLQKNYGLLKSKDILLKLSELAKIGCEITHYQAECLNRLKPKLAVCQESKKIYTKDNGPFKKGDKLSNIDLGKTFYILAKEGEKAFYEGRISEKIEEDLLNNGGFVTVNDLKNYNIKIIDPIFTEINGKTVWSIPPEGGGAILIEIINILNRDDFYKTKPFTKEYYHYLAQASKMAFIDRYFYMGDVKLINNKTYLNIFNKNYTKNLFNLIQIDKDTNTGDLLKLMHNIDYSEIDIPNGNETTHFSVIDQEGNAVSNSYTLNLRYGSKWSVSNLGFLLNGSIDAFSFGQGKPNYFGLIGNEENLFKPNKRPASNMAPVIVTDGKKIEMIIGTPGGPKIPTTLAMIILSVLGHGINPSKMIQHNRIHHQAWPDIFYKEKYGLSKDIIEELKENGYHIEDKGEPIGDVHGIFKINDDYIAISDYRREGYSSAY